MNLPKDQKVKIHARRRDDKNQLWYSQAIYIPNQDGDVDLKESEAILGTYKGVDPTGLFWSMEIVPDQAAIPEYLTPIKNQESDNIFFYFDLEIDGAIVAYKNLENIKLLPNVKFESLESYGIVANFYYPSEKKNLQQF